MKAYPVIVLLRIVAEFRAVVRVGVRSHPLMEVLPLFLVP
jgi:hypothetical protein